MFCWKYDVWFIMYTWFQCITWYMNEILLIMLKLVASIHFITKIIPLIISVFTNPNLHRYVSLQVFLSSYGWCTFLAEKWKLQGWPYLFHFSFICSFFMCFFILFCRIFHNSIYDTHHWCTCHYITFYRVLQICITYRWLHFLRTSTDLKF